MEERILAATLHWPAAHVTEATESEGCLWQVADVNQPMEVHHMASLAQVRRVGDSCSLPVPSTTSTAFYPVHYRKRYTVFVFCYFNILFICLNIKAKLNRSLTVARTK